MLSGRSNQFNKKTINSVSIVPGNISAVFTYKWKGAEITRLIENGTRVMIGITKGRTFTSVGNNINKYVEYECIIYRGNGIITSITYQSYYRSNVF